MSGKGSINVASRQLRTLHPSSRVLLVGFLVPLALDVKKLGGAGDSTLQLLLVGVSLLCGALYVMPARPALDHRPRRRSTLARVTMGWWVYIALSPIPILVWAVNFEHYLKVLLPFVLFGFGLTVMVAVERRRIDPAVLLDILLWAALLSTVWRAVYAIVIGGLSIDSMRYQILSPGTPFLLGYGLAGLYLRRRRKLAAGALFAALVVSMLSVTRSNLIVGLFVVGGLLVTAARRHSDLRAVRSGVKILLTVTIALAVSLQIATLARPNLVDAWSGRFSQNTTDTGLDFTLATRLAEYSGQLTSLTQNTFTLLIGNGIGAEYTWSSRILQDLPFRIDDPTRWDAGHSTWVYPFFASGVLMGAIVPLLLLVALVRGFSSASARKRGSGSSGAVIAFSILMAYLGGSFTANILLERHSGVILGVVVGAVLIYAGRVPRRDAPAGPRHR